MSKNKWTYYISATWEDKYMKHSFATHLYSIGVYCILDNDACAQMNIPPSGMQKLCNILEKRNKENKITNLTFGRKIVVIKEGSLYKEEKL